MSVSAISGSNSAQLAQNFASMSPQQMLNPNGQLFNASLLANQEDIMGASNSRGSKSSANSGVNSTSGQGYMQALQGNSGLNNLSSAEQSDILGQEGLTQALSAYQDPMGQSNGSQGGGSGSLFDAEI